MIKILHAADLHLDSPFAGLPPEKAARRRGEQRALLASIIQLAESNSVDIMLFAGDLLDSDSSGPETAEQLLSVFSATQIPIFISPGNHDYCSPSSPYMRLNFPANVHIFNTQKIECVVLPELDLRVWGAGFQQSTCPPLLADFEAEKRGSTLDVMCIHGTVDARISVYNPISRQELAASGMDYVALGHVHAFSGLQRAGETFYAYSGCPEGRGFDETGEKGVIIAELQAGDCRVSFVPLSGRRYEILEIDLGEDDDHLSAVLRQLPGDCSRDIYRIILRGECEISPDLNTLAASLEDKFYSLQIKDRTEIRRDLWQSADGDTLRGLFLARLWDMYCGAQDEDERVRVVSAARWGLAALENREEPYADK